MSLQLILNLKQRLGISTLSQIICIIFRRCFYFKHRCRVQRPILITNSDREKCPPCALWVSCDLVCRRALVNMCPLLLINMTWGQKWPFSFGSTQSFCTWKHYCARDSIVPSYRSVFVHVGFKMLTDFLIYVCTVKSILLKHLCMCLRCIHLQNVSCVCSSFLCSLTALSTQRKSETRKKCVTTWSEPPSTATMWQPRSSSRRLSTSWLTNMEPGEALLQGKTKPTLKTELFNHSNLRYSCVFLHYWVILL